jgi:hypothetical protein
MLLLAVTLLTIYKFVIDQLYWTYTVHVATLGQAECNFYHTYHGL